LRELELGQRLASATNKTQRLRKNVTGAMLNTLKIEDARTGKLLIEINRGKFH
jgi:hypothetical protein